jgi:tRNA/tmRNA/rRNA uracil-C5-methylase (TrmA/RlmC/RlmD family)
VSDRPEVVDHYGAHYREFAADVYADVRRAAFGEDIGQNTWLTVEELQRFVSRLGLRAAARLLDLACGSGGPSLRIAQLTECQVVGVEIYDEAVAEGARLAQAGGLQERASSSKQTRAKPPGDQRRHGDRCADFGLQLGTA